MSAVVPLLGLREMYSGGYGADQRECYHGEGFQSRRLIWGGISSSEQLINMELASHCFDSTAPQKLK